MASTLPLRSFSISGSIDGFSVCKRAANQIPAAQGVSAMPISMAIALAPDKSAPAATTARPNVGKPDVSRICWRLERLSGF